MESMHEYVRSYRPPRARRRAAAMALSKLSGDAQGIILGQLCNPLEPSLAVYFSSANRELRLLLTPALKQQLKAGHEAAVALCHKMGMRSCKELREAKVVSWMHKGLSAADLTTLGTLGSVLPALEQLFLGEHSSTGFFRGSVSPDGVQRLAERLAAGALPAVTLLFLCMPVRSPPPWAGGPCRGSRP